MLKIVFIALVLSIVIPFGAFYLGERKLGRMKRLLGINALSFFSVLTLATTLLFNGSTFAEGTASVGSTTSDMTVGMAYLSAALVTGLSSIAAGIAVGSAASAALGAISENEAIVGKALIFVALAEGIALYGLLISFTILGKV